MEDYYNENDDGGLGHQEGSGLGRPLLASFRMSSFGSKLASSSSGFRQKLNEYKDVMFSILFYLHLFIIVIMGFAFGLSALKFQDELSTTTVDKSGGLHEQHSNSQNSKFIGGIIIVAAIGAFLSLSYAYLMTYFSKVLIIFTFASAILIMLVLGIVLFTMDSIAGGLGLIILAAISVLFFNLIKNRIDFASVNLKVACEAINSMPSIYLVPIFGLLLNVCYCIVWVLAVLGVATNESDDTIGYKGKTYHLSECSTFKYSSSIQIGSSLLTCAKSSCNACVCDSSIVVHKNSSCFSSELYIDPYVMLVLAILWTSSVCSNIVVCTVAGSVSAWWRTDEREYEREESSPSLDGSGLFCNPVVSHHLNRSLTANFGSICLASLIIAILRTVRLVLNFTIESISFQQKNVHQTAGSRAVLFILNILSSLLQLVDRAMEYFNNLALCYVAIKDRSLIESSRSVLDLLRERGWSLVINDNIIDAVFFLGHATVGVLCSCLALIYAHSTSLTHTNTTLLVGLGFLLGIGMCNISTSVISSAVDSVFICFAETPIDFELCHPGLFADLSDAWNKFYPNSNITTHNKDRVLGLGLEDDELIISPPNTHPNAWPSGRDSSYSGKFGSSSSIFMPRTAMGYSVSSENRSSGLGLVQYSHVEQGDGDNREDNESAVPMAMHSSQAYSWNNSAPFDDKSVYFGDRKGGLGEDSL